MKGLVLDANWEPKPDYELSEFEEETGKAIEGNSVWKDPSLEVREMERPSPGRGEVLLKVKAVGICGSDVHFYETDEENYMLYPGLTKFPISIGHEFAGEIVKLGPGPETESFHKGDRVTCEEMVWCGHCRSCRDGLPNHCKNLEEIGITIDGALAEYIAVPAKLCWDVAPIFDRYGEEETAWGVAATTEPTSVAYNTIFERGEGFRPGAYVVIYGAGPIGLAGIQLAKAAGAAKVISFEPSPERLKLAEKVGADHAFDPTAVDPAETVLQLTDGQGADFQVEAAGAPGQTIPQMEESLAINSKISQVGRAAERVPTYLETFQVKRAQIYGSQGHSGHGIFPSVIRMIGAGLVDNSRIITSVFPLAEGVEAVKQASRREDGKVIVRP